MQFKSDENLPVEVKEILATAGHDTMTVHDQKMVGKPDSFVAAVCREECRSLLTLDLDFSDIRAYPPANFHGIIVLRPRTLAKPAVLALVSQLIPLLGTEPLQGKLWIVQENGLRIRG